MGKGFREVGSIEDVDGNALTVTIDSGDVFLGDPEGAWRFTVEQADELAALLITALWQAARQAGEGSG